MRSQVSRVISSNWPNWTVIACGPERTGQRDLLPNDWAPVYFSGSRDTLGCVGGVAPAGAGGGRSALGRLWGWARRLRFSRRKRFCAFAARQQKDIAMHTSIGAVAERPFARRL